MTCSDWLDLDSLSAVLFCSKECTDSCKGIIDNVYAVCSATDTTATGDDGELSTAQEIEFGVSFVRNDDCNDYADTKSFKGSDPTAEETCDFAFTDAVASLFFGDDCAAVDGACPPSCGDLFAGVYAVCKGKNKTDDDTGDQVPFSAVDLVGIGFLIDQEGA